jgi:type 1 glutamine amidotransferase
MRQALIVWGGAAFHEPETMAGIFADLLRADGFDVEVSPTLDSFIGLEKRTDLDLIVPSWTAGTLTDEQVDGVYEAVRRGVGLAGSHGGMCDAFMDHAWFYVTGGQFVAHPGGDVQYDVHIRDTDHFITSGISDYSLLSEQYYMLVDPANHVLATTRFPDSPEGRGAHKPNGPVDMPVAWTRLHGEGRVFYHSVGHDVKSVTQPETLEMIRRGMLWASRAAD